MLKCYVDSEKEKILIDADGDMKNIVTDLCFLVNQIYTSLHEQDMEDATLFRIALAAALSDLESPVWNPDTSENRRAVTTCIKVPKK